MKNPRAKVARQSWERTNHNLNSSNSLGLHEALLDNYISGRQLEAGVEVVKFLEQDYVEKGEGRSYREVWQSLNYPRRTIEESMRKLEREGIITKEASWAYSKKGRKRKEYKKSSMAGRWYISWNTYITRHNNFSDLALKIQKSLEEKRK